MSGRVSRKFLYIPVIIAGLLLAIWFAIWTAGAATIRNGLEDFAAQRAAEGGVVAYAPLKTRGFPFYLRGSLGDFSISDKHARYECDRLFIDLLPYAPDRVIFSCGGRQKLTSGSRVWTIDARTLRASLARDAARGWEARIETGAASMTDGAVTYSAENAVVNFAPGETDASVTETALRITRFKAADAARMQDVERFDAAASISAMRADESFHIDIIGAQAVVDGATLSTAGEIVIDADGGATGRLNATIANPARIASTLSNLKLLDEEDAKTIGSALAMLAVASGGAIAIPVDLAEDGVRINGVRISGSGLEDQP